MDQSHPTWPVANRLVTEEIGGHAAVAKLLGLRDRRNVWPWTSGERQFPAEHCAKLEAAGKTVTRRDLRPDDWQEIWPEMAKRPRKPAGDGMQAQPEPQAQGV